MAKMSVQPSRSRYLASLADEVLSSADRVRNLIGSKHWPTDGYHKEAILLAVLGRHLPAGTHASRGFVVSAFESDCCSKEQDILILDTFTEGPLFDQGNVVIACEHQVLGSISVKSQLTKETLEDTVQGLRSINAVPSASMTTDSRWYGMYFFNESETVERNRAIVAAYLNDVFGTATNPSTAARLHGFDCLCCGRDILAKARYTTEQDGTRTVKPIAYDCNGLAPAIFVADLLDHIAAKRGAAQSGIAASLDSMSFAKL
jgi:hypothetical protein